MFLCYLGPGFREPVHMGNTQGTESLRPTHTGADTEINGTQNQVQRNGLPFGRTFRELAVIAAKIEFSFFEK